MLHTDIMSKYVSIVYLLHNIQFTEIIPVQTKKKTHFREYLITNTIRNLHDLSGFKEIAINA